MSAQEIFSAEEHGWMRRALELAQLGRGITAPNPMVGAVVVSPEGKIVGEGWHHGSGTPHAEPNALDDAGDLARGASLYVTLEPCSTWGRMPPCTDRILQSGVRKVVWAVDDANPKYQGVARKILEERGIEVKSGLLEEECRELNRDFFCWITQGRPYVILKMAMTLDGKIATAGGGSRWITGEAARARVQELRLGAGAIMVGGETVRLDNPSLLVHDEAKRALSPQRYIWTSRPLPDGLQMLHDGMPQPSCIKPTTAAEWEAFLGQLGREKVMSLLLEGGGELAGNALQCGIVDEVQFFVAPKILGGRHSRPVVAGEDPQSLADSLALESMRWEQVGNDMLVTARVARRRKS